MHGVVRYSSLCFFLQQWEGFELFIIYILCCLALALISVFFNPFFINLVWSIKVQIKLRGK
nr:Uncharacterised protein [Salmonella sp. NCTC 7297]